MDKCHGPPVGRNLGNDAPADTRKLVDFPLRATLHFANLYRLCPGLLERNQLPIRRATDGLKEKPIEGTRRLAGFEVDPGYVWLIGAIRKEGSAIRSPAPSRTPGLPVSGLLLRLSAGHELAERSDRKLTPIRRPARNNIVTAGRQRYQRR